jgi:hypothetical protein
MPGRTIGKELPLGYAGTCARLPYYIISNRLVKPDDAKAVQFGAPVVLNGDNTYSAFGAGNTAAQFAGIAIREVKQATDFLNQNHAEYLPGQPADVLEWGNIVVNVGRGTPTAGGAVYIRVAANSSFPGAKIGDFEAASDTTYSVLIPGLVWATGKMGADGVAEIVVKNRV